MGKLKKVISLACMLGIVSASTFVHADTPTGISMSYQPNIDVVLTVGQTAQDLSTFKDGLTNQLRAQGIDTSKVNITSISQKSIAMTSSFVWRQYTNYYTDSAYHGVPDPLTGTSNNHIITSNGGQTLSFYGYDSPGYKDWTYYADNSLSKKTINFTFNEASSHWHTLHGTGYFFNSSLSGSGSGEVLNGYLLFINQSQIILYQAVNCNTTSLHNGSWNGLTQVVAAPRISSTIHNIQIEATPTSAKIYDSPDAYIDGSDLKINYAMSTAPGSGFGPFVSYNGHGCPELSSITFTNIKSSTESAKRLEEVVNMPEWRIDSDKYVVNVDDASVAALDNPTVASAILSRFISDGTYYLGWGPTTYQSQANNFIAKNDYRGEFIPTNWYPSVNSLVTEVATYIKNHSGPKTVSNNILIGHDVTFNVAPSYLDGTSITTDYPNGSWKLLHNYMYFSNTLGQADYNDTYIPKPGSMVFSPYLNPQLSITKPGEYTVTYQGNTVGKIYAHRKPIAAYNFSLSGTTFSVVSDTSYDPDGEYAADKGIAQKVWRYKRFSDIGWTNAGASVSSLSLAGNTDYLIELQVQDKQGEWSSPCVKYITTSAASTAIADFSLAKNPITTFDALSIIDKSYDANGKAITSEIWTISKDGNVIASASSINGYRFSTAGTYVITLQSRNSAGSLSEVFKQVLTVTSDVTAPEIIVTSSCLTGTWTNNDINFSYQFNDYESRMNNFKIIKTASSTPPATYDAVWGSAIAGSSYNYTLNTEGTWYMHVQATDNAGNVRVKTSGPYKLDKTAPTSTITVDNFVSNAYTYVPVVISNIWDGASGVNSIVASLNSDYSNAVSTTQNSGSITLKIPREKHVLNQVVYVKMTDNVGNVRTYSFNTYIEPYLPNPPVITSPANDSLLLDNEPLVLKWNYSDPIDATQKSATVTITNSDTNAKQTFVYSGTSTSFTMIPALAPGNYTIELTVTNQYDKTSGASSIKIRKNLHILSGYVCTKVFSATPITPFQYVNILTTSEVPNGTTLDGYIVYPNSNGSYEANLTDITKVINKYSFKLTNQGLQTPIRLPYKVTNIRIYYNMAAKTSNLTPVLDNLTVLAK